MTERTTNLLENLEITRIFDAPRELVWKAWTDPKLVMQWWGPKGFTSPACKIDFRVGGQYLYCMRSPDGWEGWSGGEYTEIIAPEKIASVLFYANEHGKLEPADNNDVEVRDVVTFEDIGNGQTKMVFKRSHWDEGEDEGMMQICDKLVALLVELIKRG
ncbi:SRPBCC family protein [Sapientia aquatica]|uniref:SRPBCC domain-containing protein n=1 Tax=Sapientia aquatica TaxID=1549640 RepID=A0A4R5W6J8_9BURK|nr:SRPBCC domain-containing protein [Sapientia aquatica]TDK67557.1 SRPBCC domain-containing protein [Sapientia aquatica]